MRSFTSILLAILLVSLSLCSLAEKSQSDEKEQRPSLLSQDFAKFLKKEVGNKKRVVKEKNLQEKKREEVNYEELPEAMVEAIKSIGEKHM